MHSTEIIFDCIRIQSIFQNFFKPVQLSYDFSSISVRIPLEIHPEVVRLIYQRTGMIGVLQNSRLYEDQKFKEEWENAELYFTNERQVIETVY